MVVLIGQSQQKINQCVEKRINELRQDWDRGHYRSINLASAPYNLCTRALDCLKEDAQARGEYFFHPDRDFEEFGVCPLNAACWMKTWHSPVD